MLHKENTPKAILLIILGMSIFSIQDALIKFLSAEINIFLIYFSRSLIAIIILIFYLKSFKQPIIFKTNYPFITIIRCIMFFLAFSLYYVSLTKLSLAVATTLFFASPFFISLFSMLLLNEQIGMRRWLAMIFGFIGVFLVMDPDFENFNIYTTFPIICALFYALTMVIQKKYYLDNLFSQTFHLYFAALFFSSIIGIILYFYQFETSNDISKFLFKPWAFNKSSNIFILILIGLMANIGFLSVIQSYKIGSPPSVAPFEYILIFWALLLSWMFWQETLNMKGYLGLFLIISAGLYTFIREKIKNKQVTIDKPLR